MSEKVDFGPRLGADPEFFVKNAGGASIPICGLVGGTKENPLQLIDVKKDNRRGLVDPEQPVPQTYGGYAYQEDGVAYEFNIPAMQDGISFIRAVGRAMGASVELLGKRGLHVDLEGPSRTFTTEQLNSVQAQTIGCLPDVNAWEGKGVKRNPFTALDLGHNRFCGGHIHVQYNHNNVPRHIFTQFMDLVAALPTLKWDKQGKRRSFYGQPGIYREKSYGIEYRTLSNFWLNATLLDGAFYQTVNSIFNLAELANSNPRTLEEAYGEIPWEDVQDAIKQEDHAKGAEIIQYLRRTSFPVRYLGAALDYE